MSGILRQSVANAVATGSILVGGTLGTIVVARLLGPESLGVVTYAAWIVATALTFADLGIPGALARYLPDLGRREGEAAAGALSRRLSLCFVAAAAVAVLGLLGAALWLYRTQPASAGPVHPGAYLSNAVFWLLVAAAVAGQSASGLAIGILRGRQQFGLMARVLSLAALTQVVTTVVGAWLYGVTGALAGAALVGIVPALFLATSLRPRGPVPPELRSRVARYCVATWLSFVLATVAWTRTEIFFLERSWGPQSVALFSVGLTLANLAVQAPLLLTGPLLPHLAGHVGAGDLDRAAGLYRDGMRLLSMLVVPACLGLAAILPTLVPLLYGPGFEGAVLPGAILVAAAGLSALNSVAQVYLNATERSAVNVSVCAAAAVGVVVAGLTAVPAYGLLGAALARMAIQFAATAVSIAYVQRRLGAPAPLADLARILAAALACAAVAFLLVRAFPGPATLVVAIPAGAACYALALKLLGGVHTSDLDALRRLTAGLPRPFARLTAGAVRFYG